MYIYEYVIVMTLVKSFSWNFLLGRLLINSPHRLSLVRVCGKSYLVTFFLQTSDTQVIADSLVDDFVVTESVSAVEVAIAESAAVQPVRTAQRGIHHH